MHVHRTSKVGDRALDEELLLEIMGQRRTAALPWRRWDGVGE